LFYRLSVFPVTLPPLRERPDDIPALAARFIEQAARRFGRPTPRLTARAVQVLERYSWPGNVRELQHVIERALLLSPPGTLRLDGILTDTDRAEQVPAVAAPREPAQVVVSENEWRRRERQNIRTALEVAGGRIYGSGGAAELLGVKPTTLVSRLDALGLRRTQRSTTRSGRTPR
jgi:transcriptional regulator with GAF, ATPase, and Fis domain